MFKNRSDFYMNYENCLERLKREFIQHGRLVVAFDFDNTVFDFHNEGHSYDEIIALLNRWRDYAYFICFSASTPDRYPLMKRYMFENMIPYDTINEGIEGLPNGEVKPYYNILLDDRAGLMESYSLLYDLIGDIENEAITSL